MLKCGVNQKIRKRGVYWKKGLKGHISHLLKAKTTKRNN